MVNKKWRCLKKVNKLNLQNYERKLIPTFMIYADFENYVVAECNKKQYTNYFYTHKYQKHVACIYGYKLVYVEDKFSETLSHT